MIFQDESPGQDTPGTSTPGLEILLTASPFLFCILDPDGRLRRINAAAEAVFGYSQEEIEGSGLGTVFHPDDRRNASRAIAAADDATEGPVTLRAGPSSGPLRTLDLWFSRDPSSGLVVVWGSDVTESRAIRDELRMRIELLEDLVDQRTRLLAEFQTRLEDFPHRPDAASIRDTSDVSMRGTRDRSSTGSRSRDTRPARRSPTFLRSRRGSWHRTGSPPRMTMAEDAPLKLLADDADGASGTSSEAASPT